MSDNESPHTDPDQPALDHHGNLKDPSLLELDISPNTLAAKAHLAAEKFPHNLGYKSNHTTLSYDSDKQDSDEVSHTSIGDWHLSQLGLQSIEYLLQQFKEQQLYHSQPISQQSQTQGAHAIDCILSLQSTLDAQQENLQDLIKEGNDMVGEDSASEAVLMEWQEKKVKELKLWDRVAAQKLSKLKKDKWITLQLNLHVNNSSKS
ncbi:hypothetical protein BS47DRAFT_1396768 [Hydnum rufescens UP504]|uniref:Uncharacterized protein n=1 Tax=Hydnum rufescens UP504 TaxID=1448309 RepID=A0A9P6AQ17_9AGAM|nr:hypothetical protein BS47DRAFT_1396768 [Hydnum rufescens UP504]